MFHDYRTILFITENWENIKKIREQKYLSHLNIFPVLKITVVNILITFNLSISV